MSYYSLQKQIYNNKIERKFNVTDIGKELNLMSEELSELSEAMDNNNLEGIIDAVGDLFIYVLGLCEMFKVNSDEKIMYAPIEENQDIYLRRLVKETGLIAKTLKKSNKNPVEYIDRRDEFVIHIGKLMGYCIKNLEFINQDPKDVIYSIINNNKARTHEGKI
ncbi:TPA: hypothetical protein HA235_04895 [Candidatus Woesearchaeota archaeon]|nr:hypothetical protein [Candidatus Woesearchaeota archaeon]HIH32018.1 hypothetical protein [Candidatus Woesearchaeota archaeon]HIH54443.1 hypothetical protein [Candidatus Woesearchaeota archaeon]HIJ01509.1 hypothetical protein [Candidatus Woesearchaeota archaeon]HIJ13728.1 hypothetical protein [Candidatus Woesearchaeota archaeon]